MKIAVVWKDGPVAGEVRIANGKLGRLRAGAPGTSGGPKFKLARGGRLEIELSEYTLKRGSFPTIIHVLSKENPFSFNLRDVGSDCPIYIPEYGVAVMPAADRRSFEEVAGAIASKKLQSDFARFENEPEESYENAARYNREQYCSTWLGVARDMRMFRVGYEENHKYWGKIRPCYHSFPQSVEGMEQSAYQIGFVIGQGASCRPQVARWLDEGVLPILHSAQVEQDIHYHLTMFATLEKEGLQAGKVRGTDWQAGYANTHGNMLKAEERAKLAALLEAEMRRREQEVVCFVHIEAVNVGHVPRYAWFKAAYPNPNPFPAGGKLPEYKFKDGYKAFLPDDKVLAIQRVDGKPMPEKEMAILVPPGGKTVFELIIPHSPVSRKRAEALMRIDYEMHLDACRKFWQAKLASAAKISVPEKPVDEGVKAGLLHCDLVTVGREPSGPALATIGWYSPIGTESAPIIQFYDSMGWHKLAERSIQFFLERQKENGFIQNFANYESETGPLLWTIGEHYRYTHDLKWLRRIMPKVRKAANYLLEWRAKNKKEEYRAKGYYGMVNGKVADCNDFHHQFFLNAGTYIGLKRIAEVAANVDRGYAAKLARECVEYKRDIRKGFYFTQARCPVMPLGDGSWAPLMPPWVEYTGALSLFAEGGNWFTHGSFAARGCLTGPMWLIISEVLEPDEIGSEFILKTNQYPVTLENAALSQPYYSRHDYAHIRRGEVKAFLKTYYNQMTALHDRETYTWWEHYYHASEHKTHEEAWFLMQTRWMLYLEDGDTLKLLSAVPRQWLENGKSIRLDGVKSYFGPLHLQVNSETEKGKITAELKCAGSKPPREVLLRLPHPEGIRAATCAGGVYDPAGETVRLRLMGGRAKVILRF